MGFNKVISRLPQPYLSVMLNKGSLEVLVFTGSHSPRRVIRRPEQGPLNDGREHSLRIERLPGRSVLHFIIYFFILVIVCICVRPFFLRLAFPADLWRSRWTRRPRERRPSPTTSRSTCSTSSWAGFPPKWSARPTESTSRSRAAYGTS